MKKFSNPLKIGAYIMSVCLSLIVEWFSNPLKIGAYIIKREEKENEN